MISYTLFKVKNFLKEVEKWRVIRKATKRYKEYKIVDGQWFYFVCIDHFGQVWEPTEPREDLTPFALVREYDKQGNLISSNEDEIYTQAVIKKMFKIKD